MPTRWAHLAAAGDLPLYGCAVSEGATGQAFLARLAEVTGAEVAASTDVTGRPGGDWGLEARVGPVEAASLAVSAVGPLAAYPGLPRLG